MATFNQATGQIELTHDDVETMRGKGTIDAQRLMNWVIFGNAKGTYTVPKRLKVKSEGGESKVNIKRTNAPFRDVEDSTEWYRRPAYEPTHSEMEAAHLDRAALGNQE